MGARIGVYVFESKENPQKKAKPKPGKRALNVMHPSKSHDSMLWVGLEVLIRELHKAGFEVGYTSAATVNQYDVILVSITDVLEWYRLIGEQARWPDSRAVVLVGGAGVTNVQPFLSAADCVVWGRAEDIIVELVEQTLAGRRFRAEGVCWTDEYDAGQVYKVRQADQLYPDPVRIGGETRQRRVWQERSIGCRRRCAYCLYTWTHQTMVPEGMDGSYMSTGPDTEQTFFMMDPARPARSVALDGFSERIRRAVMKPITRQLLCEKLVGIVTQAEKDNRFKLFNIVGYPGERLADWAEFVQVLAEVERAVDGREHKRWGIELACTPLNPQPCTPLAVAEVPFRDYRGRIASELRSLSGRRPRDTRPSIFWDGKAYWALETAGTASLAQMCLRILGIRGGLEHAELVRQLSRSKRFWGASGRDKVATLEVQCTVSDLFKESSWDMLPTCNLEGIAPRAKLERLWGRVRDKLYG